MRWHLHKLEGDYASYGDTLVCDEGGDVCLMFNGRPKADRDRDMNLILAAPEMLEALEYIRDSWGIPAAFLDHVIAKAKGRS